MSEKNEHLSHGSPHAARRARLIGRSFDHDAEDRAFWQTASEQLRGETLYELLARSEAIRASTPATRQELERLVLRPGRIERHVIHE